jgi:predicted enzyme related to lactoylglutathione lyase
MPGPARAGLFIYAVDPDRIAAFYEAVAGMSRLHQTPELIVLKFFFTVPSLEGARDTASALGGEVFSENWRGPGFIVCNAMDPEGNVFQVREPA